MKKKTRRKAAAQKTLHSTRFPNETAAYRSARDKLLSAEIALRRQIEAVATMRRKLPTGGALKVDYVFDEGPRTVRLSELFADGKDTLIVYSYMFGPAMKSACSSCTSILDGLDGQAPHVTQRANLVVVAKSPIARVREFTDARGWRNLRLLSSAGNTYNADYHGELPNGSQIPTVNVFRRQNGRIHHTWSCELLFVPPERGQDARHSDLIWPLWNLFDMTPEGRGTTWHPKLKYD